MGQHRNDNPSRHSAAAGGRGHRLAFKATGLRASLTGLLLLAAGCSSGGGASFDGPPGSGGIISRPGSYGDPLSHTTQFTVYNSAPTERTQTVQVTVPFAEGVAPNLNGLAVDGHQTAWSPMCSWPDGSVRLAQALFTTTLQPASRDTFTVGKGLTPLTGAFVRNDWVERFGGGAVIGARVQDNQGVNYEAYLQGSGEILQESYLHRVTRHRTYHHAAAGGIGRDFLSSTFYVTEFRDVPVQIVDWVLGNDYLGADNPQGSADPNMHVLGPVDVNGAWFMIGGVADCDPYRPGRNGIGGLVPMGNGLNGNRVMTNDWIGDGQTRRYRFYLRYEAGDAAPADLQRWRETHSAMVGQPLRTLASLETWQLSKAMGLHGGPLTGPANAGARAAAERDSWQGRNHFGTWGGHGDTKGTATTGTPRNGPVSPELAHAIQSGFEPLLEVLEHKAWIQAVRPYHLYGLRVGDKEDLLLWYPLADGNISAEHLGRNKLRGNDPHAAYRTRTDWAGAGQTGHGWNGYDHEHWSTDLLFDYWTVSNDAWAKEELRQLGQSLKGLMREQKYYTAGIQAARAEGWCMTGFVHCYLATGDENLKQYASRRIRNIVQEQRKKDHPSKAVTFKANYPGTSFPMEHEFFMPWQHGPLMYGYLAAYRYFQEPLALTIAEDVVDTVEYSWVVNYNDPNRGLVGQGLRYYTPVSHNLNPISPWHWDATPGVGVRWGDSPLGGAHGFLVGGLHLLPDYTTNGVIGGKALYYGGMLLSGLTENDRWYKWNLVVPEYQVQ